LRQGLRSHWIVGATALVVLSLPWTLGLANGTFVYRHQDQVPTIATRPSAAVLTPTGGAHSQLWPAATPVRTDSKGPSRGTSSQPSGPAPPSAPPTSPPTSPTPAACGSPVAVSGMDVAQLLGDTYHLQANEYSSSAAFEVTSDGCSNFDIANAGISQAQPYGVPGGYPSLYKGCHWGDCTWGSGLPVEVSSLTAGVVTTADDTTTVSSGAWDDAYDIWFNSIATGTQGTTTGLEIMVWLDHYGGIQPAGGIVATDVVVGGNTYDVWYSGSGSNGGTVSYVLVAPVSHLSFDLAPLADDALARGYMPSTWYLIDVEAGFEVWQGGQGLGVQSFTVNVAR
jgi:hypothetical protein